MAFKDDLDQKLSSWLRGRNGADSIVRAVGYLALILIVIDLIFRLGWVVWIALALLIYAWWRVASKKLDARRSEDERFRKLLGPAAAWLGSPVEAMAEAKDYKHLRCPSCSQRVRVPRGKGRVRVTCPRCKEKFEAKS